MGQLVQQRMAVAAQLVVVRMVFELLVSAGMVNQLLVDMAVRSESPNLVDIVELMDTVRTHCYCCYY